MSRQRDNAASCNHRARGGLRRLAGEAALALCVPLVTGCAPAPPADGAPGSTPSTAPEAVGIHAGLPPRALALPLGGVEPCALLAGPAVAQLGVGPGSAHGATSTGTAAQCQWSTLAAHPDEHWMARVLLHQGADAVFVNPSDTPLSPVDGVTAVQVATPSNPARECALYLDTAPQQSLLVTYSTDSAAGPDTTHALACEKAERAAAFMMQRLRTLVHQPGG